VNGFTPKDEDLVSHRPAASVATLPAEGPSAILFS
jgi:hypothetical protein